MINARSHVLTGYEQDKLSSSSPPLSTPPFRSTAIKQLGVSLCPSPKTCCASSPIKGVYKHNNTTYTALLTPFAVISAQLPVRRYG
jgi:hypothetical protein